MVKKLLMLARRFYGGQQIRSRSENGLLREIKVMKDSEKRRFRYFITCLEMNGIIKQNYKIRYALWTERDHKANRMRSRNRRMFKKFGLVKSKNDHIHHIDGNVFHNKFPNLEIVNGKKHKRAHRHRQADRQCQCFLKLARLTPRGK